MGFTEILTLIFIVLKLTGVISWSWWLVCLPEIIAFVLYVVICTIAALSATKMHRTVKKHFKRFDI